MRFRSPTVFKGQFVAALAAFVWACSSADGGGGTVPAAGIGGATKSSGGAAVAILGSGGAPSAGTSSALPVGGTSAGGNTVQSTGGLRATGGSSPMGSGTGQGGSSPTGGSRATGGSSSTGGTRFTGGSTTTGGGSTTGGAKTTAGNSSTGGSRTTGGSQATGGLATTMGGTSSASTGSDGCTDILAAGVTLSEVAVFQSGKISVMKGGSAVTASTTYGADIVEARPTLFRAYVNVDSGFQARQLSARLVLNDGASSYYSKQSINASSSELTAANSFLISVPASDIRAGLNYSIKIVECGSGTGTAHNPQFPTDGQASIATRLTGPIKITAIPVTANNITPSLDSTFTSSLKKAFDAMYPTSDTQITVSSTPITGCTITPSSASDGTAWSSCLDKVRSRRSTDRPASDVYYLGILTPATSLSGFCGTACIAGISYEATATGASSRASLAIGFMPQAQNTCAHEIGHAHGLAHSPGCNASSADANFPYVTNGKAYIGWTGWDSRTPTTLLDPAKYTDIMAYCSPQWVSDYVYSKWEDRVATLNGAAAMIGLESGTWRVLNVVGSSVQWGVPIEYPEVPSGEPESAAVLDSAHQTIEEITVYRTNVAIDSPNAISAATYMIPEPQDYWEFVQIGNVVAKFQ